MSITSIVLVVLVAFLTGMEGILDEFQFHQPLVVCTLVGLITDNLEAGIILGDALQVTTLGWTNIGAAIVPDAALASVALAVILVLGGQGVKGVPSAIAIAVPLAVAGLFLTIIMHTIAIPIVHLMDAAAEEGNIRTAKMQHIIAACLQGVRIVVSAAALLFILVQTMQSFPESVSTWLTDGMAIGGGAIVAVGYALVISMMTTREVWPFFIIGFVVAAISQLTLIVLDALDVALALIYLSLFKTGGSSNNRGGSNSGDPLDDILNDY